MMLYDILVYEEDEGPGGGMSQKSHPENGVSAKSPKELVGLYAMCGQKIKILREYPDPNQPAPAPVAKPTPAPAPVSTPVPTPAPTPVAKAQPVQQVVVQAPAKVDLTPRYFSVGGIDCKQVGSKIYQKQWMTLSKNEVDNIRIINDKNNKIVSLDGKHVEVKKWVLVEDVSETTDESELQLLND